MKQPNWDTCDSSEEGQQCRQRMQAGRCTRTAAPPDRRATCHQEARVSITLYLRIALTKVRCHVITVLQRTKRSPQKPGNYNEGPGGGGVKGMQEALGHLQRTGTYEMANHIFLCSCFMIRGFAAYWLSVSQRAPPRVGAGQRDHTEKTAPPDPPRVYAVFTIESRFRAKSAWS